VRRLEEAGVIAGYVVLVAPERVGLGLTAYIHVRLEKHTEGHKRSPMDAFAAAAAAEGDDGAAGVTGCSLAAGGRSARWLTIIRCSNG
jgi:DNA-binding Lrp family transcriptional regulator